MQQRTFIHRKGASRTQSLQAPSTRFYLSHSLAIKTHFRPLDAVTISDVLQSEIYNYMDQSSAVSLLNIHIPSSIPKEEMLQQNKNYSRKGPLR